MTRKNIAAFDPNFEEALSNLLEMMRSKLDGSHSTNEHDFSYASLPDSFFLWPVEEGLSKLNIIDGGSLNLKGDYEDNMAVTVFRWLVSSPLCTTEACYGASRPAVGAQSRTECSGYSYQILQSHYPWGIHWPTPPSGLVYWVNFFEGLHFLLGSFFYRNFFGQATSRDGRKPQSHPKVLTSAAESWF